jgi:predicted nucleic acid-binding protein
LVKEYAFIEHCNEYDQAAVDLLLIEHTGQIRRDRGEAEAIQQAIALGASVMIDDRRGRKLASIFDLELHGTLWVLRQLYDQSLLSAFQIEEALSHLEAVGIRLPKTAIQTLSQHIRRDG